MRAYSFRWHVLLVLVLTGMVGWQAVALQALSTYRLRWITRTEHSRRKSAREAPCARRR
jgi:hypothetical protein